VHPFEARDLLRSNFRVAPRVAAGVRPQVRDLGREDAVLATAVWVPAPTP